MRTRDKLGDRPQQEPVLKTRLLAEGSSLRRNRMREQKREEADETRHQAQDSSNGPEVE